MKLIASMWDHFEHQIIKKVLVLAKIHLGIRASQASQNVIPSVAPGQVLKEKDVFD